MPPEVSDNQLRLMVAIRDAHPQVQTSEFLGQVRDRDRQPIGYDNARKQLGRLEGRGTPLVHGEGAGRQRTWGLTDVGLELVSEMSPAKVANGASGVRPYVVLEELDVRELVSRLLGSGEPGALGDIDVALVLDALPEFTVYSVAQRVDAARNTEHAYRQAAKGVFRAQQDYYEKRSNEEGDPVFTVPAVAVDAKRFQTKEVDVDLGASVTIR